MVDGRGRILLLDTDALLVRALCRSLAKIAEVVPVDSCAAANRALRERKRWLGFISDVALPDGSGLDWLESVRKARRHEPALFLTSTCAPAFVNRAFELRASYLCKPFESEALRAFIVNITVRDAALRVPKRVRTRLPMSELAWRLSVEYRLTPSEVEVVAAAVRGASREELVASRGISMNTLKTQVKRALRKLGADSLAEVRARLESGAMDAATED